MNNNGFSLLEVLIAIVILCIVSIPLLHAFATAAKTNGRAKVLLNATSVAEDLMEDTKYLSVDDLIKKYGASSKNIVNIDHTTGIHNVIISNEKDMSQKLPADYYVRMTLDPTLYPNANALNLSDFSTVSASDSAVYTMSKNLDNSVYEKFAKINEEAFNDDPSKYIKKDLNFFKDNLNRTITVSIIKDGTDKTQYGEDVDLVCVNIKVKYELKNYIGILDKSDSTYEVTDAQMYNNLVTKTPLSSAFILFYPRYLAAEKVKGDNIVVENVDNVKANLYVVAQDGAMDSTFKSQYLSNTIGLNLKVIEDVKGTGFPSKTTGALTLRTNLNSGAPYTAITGDKGKTLCNLTYQNLSGSLKTTGEYAQNILNTGDINGKALEPSQVATRIYKVLINVCDNNGNSIVELDGTKLE